MSPDTPAHTGLSYALSESDTSSIALLVAAAGALALPAAVDAAAVACSATGASAVAAPVFCFFLADFV